MFTANQGQCSNYNPEWGGLSITLYHIFYFNSQELPLARPVQQKHTLHVHQIYRIKGGAGIKIILGLSIF